MKKLLCALMALTTVFCFAGCVDHNDGECDECGAAGLAAVVVRYDDDTELCLKCAAELAVEELEDAE